MNILFLTMVSGLKNIETSGIYTDLMRKFRDKGNEVYIICLLYTSPSPRD